MSLSRAPRATVMALVVAVAVLTGCSDPKPETAPPTKAPSASAPTTAPSATTTTTPSATTTTTPPASTVTAAPGFKATDKAVIARYGQKDADLARSTALMIGHKMSVENVITGKIKGDDVLGPLVDVMDAALIKDLKAKPKSRDSLAMGNLPYTVYSASAPMLNIGQPAEATLDGNPVVTVPVTVAVEEKTKEYGNLRHERNIVVYLVRQNEASEGTWRMTGFTAKPDEFAKA